MHTYHLRTRDQIIAFHASNDGDAEQWAARHAPGLIEVRRNEKIINGDYTIIWTRGGEELKRLAFEGHAHPDNDKAWGRVAELRGEVERKIAAKLTAPLRVLTDYAPVLVLPPGWSLGEAPKVGEDEADLGPAFAQFLTYAKADLAAAHRVATAAAVAAEMNMTAGAVNGAVNGSHSRTLDRLDRWCRIWAGKGHPAIRIIADTAGVRLER